MKKNLYYSLMGCILGMSPIAAAAQSSPLEVERGGEIELNAPADYESYQWQVSTDAKYFTNLPGEKGKSLKMKVYAPCYLRVRGTLADNGDIVYPDTVQVDLTHKNFRTRIWESGGGHGFVETQDGEPYAQGISIPEDRKGTVEGNSKKLTKWTNGKSRAAYYFNHPKSTIDANMLIKVKKNAGLSLKVTVWDPDDMDNIIAQNIVSIQGTGQTDTINFISFDAPNSGYYRYQLDCLSGWNNIIELSKFHHLSTNSRATWKPGYTNSPSAHLNAWRSTNPAAPKDKLYDWCYLEVMMPEESNYRDTYVMSLGVLKGYMGIQMNGWSGNEPQHGVIFSMWDDGDTDSNPNLPDNLRANVVDHGEGVKYERFANEGTGMKTFKGGNNWDCGTFVQFITNCRPEETSYTVIKDGKEEVIKQKNTLVSTWFNAQDGKGWQYMGTLRLANKSIYFDSWYSFLENFYTAPAGQVQRKGFYRNGYAHSKTKGEWFHFNQVNFGHTDGSGKVGSRDDYGQGISTLNDGSFFMTTGSFVSRNSNDRGAFVPLNKVNTPVDTINLKKLLDRVDLAVAHEKEQIDAKENFKKNKLKKDGWKVISFSSEEASGEGSNGHAAQIIDGDEKTYWHSQWQGNKAQYPHSFVIDMADMHDVNGIQIASSDGGGKRHIKACELYLSQDNQKWEKVHTADNLPDQDVNQFYLHKSYPARYLKIVITKGYASEGPFVRVNEIEVTAAPTTGVDEILGEKLHVACGKGELLVSVPTAMTDAEISVYRADGACISNVGFPTISAGETVRIPMPMAAKGVYVVSCKAGNFNVSKQIMWKR